MRYKYLSIVIVILFLLLTFTIYSHGQPVGESTIIDSRHYSNVLGETRNYRIFLPPTYFDKPEKKYPVIYFFHGWSQRYFGSSDPYADFDKGEDNKGDNIATFVSTHEVIVVKPDGYNRSPDEKYYVRPYNVSPVETYRQFPIYFPELVDYIDTHYQTFADREHRAISGLSMGGFMTYWIAGKYPHLLSAAGSFCGSPEFEVGPKDFPVEYRHIDMYKNYAGMNVRLHYGDKDFIRGYHQDMNRVWPQVIDSYASKIYDAAHSTCGLGDMFSFILESFKNPPAIPEKWDHIDVYPNFSVWDYQVTSDRNMPGFTLLEKVDKRGFKSTVREFLPDGETIPSVNLLVTTPAIYEKNQLYIINDVDTKTLRTSQKSIRSDSLGRLTLSINGSTHEIGINRKSDTPTISIASFEIENMAWATHKKVVSLSIQLLNKGLARAKNIRATLSATTSSARVIKAQSAFGNIAVNQTQGCQIPFTFQVESDTMDTVKFKLSLEDEHNNQWLEFIEIPLKKDVPQIQDFAIADGKVFTVAQAGTDTASLFLGKGNGDGVANPGESIVLLIKDRNIYWRTHLSVTNQYVNPFGIHIRKSDNWTSFDHVGASTKYSVPVLASDCPQNHKINFYAEYWLPDYPSHLIKQGKIAITVKGKDSTPPIVSWIRIPGDNIIRAKVYDGSRMQYVKAILIAEEDAKNSFEVELNDEGELGDSVEGDNVFSKKISQHQFGQYKVVIEAMDSFGNKKREEATTNFILY